MYTNGADDACEVRLELTALSEMAGDLVARLSTDGRVEWISQRGLRLLGLSADLDVTGKDWCLLAVPPEERPQADQALHDARQSESTIMVVYAVITPSGPRQLHWTMQVLPGPGDQASGLLLVGQTPCLSAQTAVQSCSIEYRAIINAISDALCILDVNSGAILDANDRAVALFGYSVEAFRHLAYGDVSASYPPYSQREAQAKIKLARAGHVQQFEWLARHKDGHLFWIEVRLQIFKFQSRDCIVVMMQDISKLKTSEQAIRESEKKFRQLAESIGEVFWLGSTDWKRVFYISPAYERLWGRPLGDLYAKPLSWLDDIHPEDRDTIRAHMAKQTATPNRPLTFPEFRAIRPDGSARWVQARSFPVTDDTGVAYRLASIMEDITERVEARQGMERITERLEDMVRQRTRTLNRMNEELIREVAERREAEAAMAAAKETAEAASRAKSEFLTTMSHEIRTPMNGILGMVQLLGTTALDDDQRANLADIEESATTLLTLISNILDFSKIESDTLELVHEPFSPLALLESIREDMTVLARTKQLALSLNVAPDLPDILIGDAERLRQVLVNLVGNAIKFTQHGGVVIGATRAHEAPYADAPRQDAPLELDFSVADTGIGIQPEDTGRIFDSFTQADGSYTRRFGGTGLGLAISKRIVERMGGVLEVSSEPGRGSVFTFNALFDQETPS